ncbi:hypothetical protein [Methanobrevibacter woesei]|uniref:hypothetical protein n=1 Tax=Methanobrevibacter woesei TaxID=190976 RepID=UPI00255C12C9|nr:hypothetical protein [Methanobrevibacter woesei]
MIDLTNDITGFSGVCNELISKEFKGLNDEQAVKLIKSFSKKKLAKFGFILYDSEDKLVLYDMELKQDLEEIDALYENGKINLYTYRLTYFY